MISVILIATAMMLQSAEPAMSKNDSPIISEETGVATSYEAMKKISCGNVEWRVNWKSAARGQISGDVTVLIAGESKAVTNVQAEVFSKFATIDGVSATCNEGVNGHATRSTLLMTGNNLENSEKSLAQGNIAPDRKVQWSFNAAE